MRIYFKNLTVARVVLRRQCPGIVLHPGEVVFDPIIAYYSDDYSDATNMAVKDIRLLGDPLLRADCAVVRRFGTRELSDLIRDLHDTLSDFRARRGFGRGIAAPQIGETRRVICIRADQSIELVNPAIVRRGRKQMLLWDDCLSFPDLLVKVKRSYSIEVTYQDASGKRHRLRAEGPLSELLQHEIDHINGILAIDRAIDSTHIVMRSELEKLERGKTLTL